MAQLSKKEHGFVQWSIWAWAASLVGVTIWAGVIALISAFALMAFAIPTAGLLLAAWAVLPAEGASTFVFKRTAAEQETQLKHLRSLAGVQAGIGLAFIATIGIFDMDELAQQMLTATLVWTTLASVYFVAFWGSARIEAERNDGRPSSSIESVDMSRAEQ